MNLQLDQIEFYVEQVLYYSRLDSFSKDYLLHETSLRPLINDVALTVGDRFLRYGQRVSDSLTFDEEGSLFRQSSTRLSNYPEHHFFFQREESVILSI